MVRQYKQFRMFKDHLSSFNSNESSSHYLVFEVSTLTFSNNSFMKLQCVNDMNHLLLVSKLLSCCKKGS